MKRIKLLIASVFLAPLVVSGAAFAATPNIENEVCQGATQLQFAGTPGAASPDCDVTTGTADDTVNSIITNVINIISVIVGVVAVIMILVGGFKYITSGGDSGNVTGAKNTILYAIIGLVIVALAQVIVRFVLNRATQTT